jgi:hypothetical protein
MTGSAPPLPVNPTGQLAESIPGFDPTPVIAAGDQRLADYLAAPTQRILDQLGLPRLSGPAHGAPLTPGAPANPAGAINALDPTQLISPVINALGTLGSGQFSGMDPTSTLNGISNAFDGISGPVRQALGAVQHGWQGVSSAAAGAKTGAALANGAEVAAQATGLKNSLASAAADVAQARLQLIEIIHEFLATLAAIGPSIIFPWGWAAVVAAAAKAVAHTAQVMTEVQSSLGAQAGAVSAIGAPVTVTAASKLAASATGPLGSLLGGSTSSTTSPMSAMSMLSPLMMAASAGISPAMSAASMAGSAGGPAAATGASTGTLAGATGTDPKAPAGGAGRAGGPGVPAGPVSPHGGGAGAASGGTLVSRVTPPMPPSAPETTTAAMPAATTRPTTGGIPMGGAGMMSAPLAGAAGNGGAHTAASYLHTSDQGGKVVTDRSTVAPPVIGETDPNDTPDIELRI